MKPAVRVEWHSVQYATSYDVYRNGTLFYSTHGGADLYDLDVYETPGVAVTYFVIAKNAAGTSTSNSVDVTVPADICVTAPPVAVLAANATCGILTHTPVVSLTWTNVPGVQGWQVYRNGSPYAVPQGRGYGDTNVEAGQTYTYRVATNGLSAPLSNIISVSVPDTICVPGPFSVTQGLFCNDAKSAVWLNWTPSVNAGSYIVMRDATTLASGLTYPPYYDTSVAVGATYSYQVIATNSSRATPSPSATTTVSDEVCPPERFIVSALATCINSSPAVLLKWAASSHAESYVVSRDGVPVSGTLPATVREYIDAAASLNYHSYSVKASNAVNYQISSADISLSAAACGAAPGAFTASVSAFCNGGAPAVRVTWSAASGAASYVVSRNGVALPGVRASPATTYDDTTANVGQSCAYSVVASNTKGNTTAPAGTITPSAGDCSPGPFTLVATPACNPPVTLTWTAAPNNVLSYSIFRNEGPVTTVGSNVLTYADNSALPAGAYTYFVRAVGLGGSSESNSITATVDGSLCDTPAPDLVAIDITSSTSSGRAGDTIAVTIAIKNSGNMIAPVTTARIRFGRGPSMLATDSVLATVALTALAPLANVQRTINVKLPAVAAGTYELFLSLDEEHVSGDPQLADNVKRSTALTLLDMIPPKRRAAAH
jgi:fibronectin type 3 domain-containing protein